MPDKRALTLRVSLTSHCQLRCRYCMPQQGGEPQTSERILSFEEIIQFIRFLKRHFLLNKVHLTGGDPLLRDGIAGFVRLLQGEEIPDIALTTNGQSLASLATPLKQAGLSRINISLDTLNPDTFHSLTGTDGLSQTLAGIESAIAVGFSPIKLNTVMMQGINDEEILDIARFGLQLGCQVRFLELMPLGTALPTFHDRFMPVSTIQERLARAFDLQPLIRADGSSSRNYIARDEDGLTGTIGFISPYSAPFCSDCRRLRLTASGQLIGCLALGGKIDITSQLDPERIQNDTQLLKKVTEALDRKRVIDTMEQRKDQFSSRNVMASIGG